MIVVNPINVFDITNALAAMLAKAPGVGGAKVQVEIAGEVNEDPKLNGWVGVYRERVNYKGRALTFGSGYRSQTVNLIVLVQHSDMSSGERCSKRLEDLIVNVLSVIFNDSTIGGTVENIGDEVNVVYERYQKGDGGFIQTAAVYLPVIGMVSTSVV